MTPYELKSSSQKVPNEDNLITFLAIQFKLSDQQKIFWNILIKRRKQKLLSCFEEITCSMTTIHEVIRKSRAGTFKWLKFSSHHVVIQA